MALSAASLVYRVSLRRMCLFQPNRTTPGRYLCINPTAPLQSRPLSSGSRGSSLVRHVSSKLRLVKSRYERFLQRRFPRFYKLYHAFTEGLKMLLADVKEVTRIQGGFFMGKVTLDTMPYRDMEKLRQVRRDLIKAFPIMVISIPPFANYLVFVLMYYFPRQMLVPYFWTPQQRVEFRGVYHAQRLQSAGAVLRSLQDAAGFQLQEGPLQIRLKKLCSDVQNGTQPKASDIVAVRGLFSGPPLGVKWMSAEHKRHICPLLFLTPRLPGFLIGRRLNKHALELLLLDRALSRLGVQQLSDSELKQACYVRGLNSDVLSVDQCRAWLTQWLQVTLYLKGSESSLLLHTMVLLSTNYPQCRSGR